MTRTIVRAALLSLIIAGGSAAQAANPHVFRVSAQWSFDPPAPCGSFASLLVHSTQADPNVVEVIYQAGNTCDGSFQNVQATGTGVVNGNLSRASLQTTINTSDERPIAVNLDFRKTKDLRDNGPDEKVVSASAAGTVVLDGVDLTRHTATTNATITRSRN